MAQTLFLLLGTGIVLACLLDALWTTLWLEGHAGPLSKASGLVVHKIFRGIAKLFRPICHSILSLEGPAAVVTNLLVWVAFLWCGWTIVFLSDPQSILDSHSRRPPAVEGFIYYVGSNLFTMGSGDLSPQGNWRPVAAVVSFSGFGVITLAISYVLAILEAVIGKRSFASQVFALGRTPEKFVANSWDGDNFGALELQLFSLVEQLNFVTEQQRVYPMLHYYHARDDIFAAPLGVVILDEATTLLEFGVQGTVRPKRVALHLVRESVNQYLDTLAALCMEPSKEVPSSPSLEGLKAEGIPTNTQDDFTQSLQRLSERRMKLLGLVQSELRDWPSDASGDLH